MQRIDAIEDIAADRVVDHIRAAPVGQRLDPLAKVFRAVVDQVVGTVLLRVRELLVAACGRDHGCAQALADLHRREPDTAGGAQHQQRLALGQRRAPDERVVAGAIDHGKGRSDVERHRIGDRNDGGGRRHHLLGHTAVGAIDEHAGAGCRPVRAGSEFRNRARAFEAGAEGEGRPDLILAFDQEEIGEVHTDRGDGDAHLARPERGRVHSLDRKGLGRAEGPAENRFHGIRSLRMVEE